MAAFIEEFNSDRLSVTITVSGALQNQELMGYAEQNGHDKCVSPTIWDLRGASWRDIPPQFLLSNFEVARKFGKSGHKTAFVFNPESGRDLITMLEQHTSSGISAPRYRAFASVDEAASWVVRGKIPPGEAVNTATQQA